METVSLKKYLEKIIELNDKLYNEKFNSAKEAVIKAETATEKRFESVNEFRNTLADQQRTFIPRAESEVKFEGFSKTLDEIQAKLNKTDNIGKGKTEGWGWAVGIVSFIVMIITLITKIL